MDNIRSAHWILWMLALSLVIAGCRSSLPQVQVEATPTVAPSSTSSPLPIPATVEPVSPLPTPTRGPFQLVVLHTNDNWGETEPCG